jgi:Cu(I)/Ag(I) efflux system membrane fusion protein/cobalt-zinc-cadmium efflux system membrane fusion protein
MTRTGKVRCEFKNPKGRLYPGMFAHVALELPMGRQTVIPDGAVLRTGTHNTAFIDRGDGYLTPVELELGSHVGNEFIVLKGLTAGQRIVSSASFLIDSESQLQAAAGTFVPPPPGVGANASDQMAQAAPQATITLASEPDPPTRGHNKMTITLKDAGGKAISDAKVTVSFYMAAMPAMGMAAMRAEAAAQEQTRGVYVATIDLQSGGTWSVTLIASQSGRTVATKQMDVSVSGPMAM